MPKDPRKMRQSSDNTPQFTAVILAGVRSASDPLLEQEKEATKAFIRLAGRPMIDYVLKAAQRSGFIDDIYVCADFDLPFGEKTVLLKELKDQGIVKLVDSREGPAESLSAALEKINDTRPVLVTTADHPLLTRAILKEFLQKSLRAECDATVGVIPTDIIENAYPANRRTRISFKDGGYTGCNLFTLMTPKSRTLPGSWESVQEARKSPLKIAQKLGPGLFLRYLAGLLTLNGALAGLSKNLDINIQAVRMHQPESGIDVDTTQDLNLVRDIIQNY